MRPTVFQRAELRDENDNIIQQGTYGKGSALSNSTNDAWIDHVMNNLEALYGIAKDEVVPVSALPASGDMNKTYLLTTTGVCYRWDGTEWVEISSSEAVGRAEAAADLAEEWATKTDGTVADNEYSAKYYANAAQQSADDAQDVADDMATHLSQIDQNTGGVSANSKRISNIEKLLQGNLYDYDTDDDTAYTKSVPAGAMPYAGLEQIGGKTVIMNQLCSNGNFADNSNWSGSNISVADNTGYFTATAQYGGIRHDVNLVAGHTYLAKARIKTTTATTAVRFGFNNSNSVFSSSTTNTVESTEWQEVSVIDAPTTLATTQRIFFADIRGADWDEISVQNVQLFDLTLMFGSGNEPSTVSEFQQTFPAVWYAYNKGQLLSAGVTEVESVGRNLLNPAEVVQGSINGTDGSDRVTNNRLRTAFIPVVGGETYTISCKTTDVSASDRIYVMEVDYYGANKEYLQYGTVLNFNTNVAFASDVRYVRVLFRKANNDVILPSELQEPMFAKGSNVPYVPYTKTEYPIPTAIRNLEGYGWSAGSVHNYIDYERKVFVKRVGVVELDGRTWTSAGENPYFISVFTGAKNCAGNEVSNAISNKYVSASFNSGISPRVPNTIFVNASYIYCYTDGVNTPTGHLYYELATPVETDISQYLTDDNLIQVESGGTLTFPNSNGDDYQIPVPSEETYMIDLQEAINNG